MSKAHVPNAVVSQASAMAATDDGNACGPVRYAESFIGLRDQPIDEGGLFEIRHTVQPRGYPVARCEHIACNLRLHCIYVIHQRRRGDDAARINRGRDDQDNKIEVKTYSIGCRAGLAGILV